MRRRIFGHKLTLNDTFRPGVATITYDQKADEYLITMSTVTISDLEYENVLGGGAKLHTEALYKATQEAERKMMSTMVDLGKVTGKPVVDRRQGQTKFNANDRVDYVCRGVADLVQQLSRLQASKEPTDESVAALGRRYAELTEEMGKLRTAMLGAEGALEVAEMMVFKLMGAQT